MRVVVQYATQGQVMLKKDIHTGRWGERLAVVERSKMQQLFKYDSHFQTVSPGIHKSCTHVKLMYTFRN